MTERKKEETGQPSKQVPYIDGGDNNFNAFFQAAPVKSFLNGNVEFPSPSITNPQTEQHPSSFSFPFFERPLNYSSPFCPVYGIPEYQLHVPPYILAKNEIASEHDHFKECLETPSWKRELRLLKNRQAVQKYRQKKKEYLRLLEERVVFLEQRNKQLAEELTVLRSFNQNKME